MAAAKRLHALMASEAVQSSLQLGTGLLVACMFTYVLPISFPPMSCVVATWLCVVAVMASPANHLGVRLTSASAVLGSTWVGAVLGALAVTFSQLAGPMYSPQSTAVLGVLAPTILAVLAPLRVAASPPLLWAQGMNGCLAFGLTALATYTQTGIARVWYVAGTLVLANAVAAVVVLLVAALILPTHATEEVQGSIAHALLHAGVATSRYAGKLFRPLDASGPASATHNGSSRPGSGVWLNDKADKGSKHGKAAVSAVPASSYSGSAQGGSLIFQGGADGSEAAPSSFADEGSSVAADADAALFVADNLMEQLSGLGAVYADADPAAAAAPAPGGHDVAVDVEAGLGGAGEPLPLVMREAHTEEEWLQLMRRTSQVKMSAPDASLHPQPQPPISALRPRLAKAQTLFMLAAAMEPQWLRGGWATLSGRQGCYWFEPAAWGKAGASLQVLLTRLSALEAVIEDGESLHTNQHPSINPRLLNHIAVVFSKAASSLAHMSSTVRAYGSASSTQLAAQIAAQATPAAQQQQQQEQQEGVELQGKQQRKKAQAAADAVSLVCGRTADRQHCWRNAKVELATLMQEECEQHWVDVMKAAADSPVVVPSLTGVRHIMFTWSLTNAIIDAVNDLEQAVTAAVCSAPPGSGLKGLLNRLCGWVPPCMPMLSGRNQARHCYQTLCCHLPQQLKQGWPALRNMASSPVAQAVFKYWLVLCLVFEVTLSVLFAVPVIRPLNPGFGFVAASLTMSEKVEATVSKFVFWVVGTIAGGVLGFLAMWHPALATNLFGLIAVTVAAALVVGSLGVTKARVAITLVLMTLSTLILCQCCGHVGHLEIAVTRVSSVLFGVTLAVLVANLLLPWYTSAWSIQTMKSTFVTAVELVNQMHAQYYTDGAASVAAYEAQLPSCPATDDAAAAAAAGEAGVEADASTGSCASPVAAAAAAAAEVVAAAGASSALIAAKGAATCPMAVTPAVLQMLIARPLVAVQTSLLMDTVAWQRGVLSTPPVVPALLRTMFGLLDRLAGLQLALQPPSITHLYTGHAVVNYGVPMAGKIATMLQLCGRLTAAVAAVLEQPTCEHSREVQRLLCELQTHRGTMYSHMQQLRQQLHADVHRNHRRLQQLLQEQQVLQQQGRGAALNAQICPVKRKMAAVLGGVDDTVRYMGFQFAAIKVFNMIAAVANVAAKDACMVRNKAACTLK